MEMHHLPFKPRALTLAIAAVMFTSQPLSRAQAQTTTPGSTSDSEWSCQVAPDGRGWQCSAVPVKEGTIPRAPRPASKVSRPATDKTSAGVISAGTTANVRRHLDWVPKEQLPERLKIQLEQEHPWCQGQYLEPPRPGRNFKGDPDSAPIIAESDESSYDQESTASLTGNVQVRQGSRMLESDSATLNKTTNFAEFEGNVVFRETGVLMLGDRGEMIMDSGRVSLDNADYVTHESHTRGSAEKIVRNEDETMDLDGATYTSCPPGDEGWQLSAGSISLDPTTGFGTARDATVRIQGLPVFYSPYMYFPTDERRQSGFLYPTTIEVDSDSGLEFDLPYYWNIAPNYDATIAPRIISKRGFLLENEFRYLGQDHHGEIGVAGIIGKDELKKKNPYYDKDRWLVNLRHEQNFSPRWTAELDYADASDKNYLKDFNSSLNLSSSSPLNQRVGTHYIGGDDLNSWQFRIDAHKFKNMSRTSDDPYNKLPQLELSGNRMFGETLNVTYLADYTYFSRADDWRYVREEKIDSENDIYESTYDKGYGIKRAEGSRAYFEAGVNYPMMTTWGFLTPELKVRSVNYNLKNLDADEVISDLEGSYGKPFKDSDFSDSPSTTVPAFSVDSGLFFDRAFSSGLTQTLEPRMKYLYAPHVEDQEFNPIFDTGTRSFTYSSLWSDNRFNGYDRLADAHQISLGVTTRLIEEDGFERMRFGIGQIVYLEDRKVYIASSLGSADREDDWDEDLNAEDQRRRDQLTDPVSPLASELIYNFNRTMSLRQDFAWNGNENRIDNYGITYRYQPDNRKTLNLGFRFRDQVERYIKDEDNHNIPVDPSDPSKGYQTARNDLKQTDVSFAWPIPYTNNWTGLGRWQYDLTNKRNLEELAGVEYNSCCYQVRLFWRSWIEPDDNIDHPDRKSGVFLQFVLSGLGSITGTSGKEYLEGIKGYTIREK
ncbi:MAG: LPS-assembly protein LptD [Endozoicomonas sp.]